MTNTDRYPGADSDSLNLSWRIEQSISFYISVGFSWVVAHNYNKRKDE